MTPVVEPAVVLHLPVEYRGGVDTVGLCRWFAARAASSMEAAGERSYARVLRTPRGSAAVGFADPEGSPTITLRAEDRAELPAVEAVARRLFDTDTDTAPVDAALMAEPALAPVVRASPGTRLPGAVDLTEILVRAILGQQVTVGSARTQLARLIDELGDPAARSITPPGIERATLFPTAARIAERAGSVIRGPRRRTETIVCVCASIADGTLTIADNPGREELVARLLDVPGIGPWTADYVTMRLLGHPDVLVRKDVAILRGARLLGVADSFPELERWAARCAPWRSYLSMHLWRVAAG